MLPGLPDLSVRSDYPCGGVVGVVADGSVGLVVADGSVVVVPLFGLIVSLVDGEVRSLRLLDRSVVVEDGSVLDCGSADWVVEGVVD